jgi:hypothetical protein
MAVLLEVVAGRDARGSASQRADHPDLGRVVGEIGRAVVATGREDDRPVRAGLNGGGSSGKHESGQESQGEGQSPHFCDPTCVFDR